MAKKNGGIFNSGADAAAGKGDLSDEAVQAAAPARSAAYHSFLGAGSSVEGKLVCTGPTRIGGHVSGEIVGDNLVSIDKDAQVKADINVKEARIEGHVFGNINAAERVSLAASACIEGDIKTPSLTIEQGAEIKGQIDVGRNAAGMAKPNAAAAPAHKEHVADVVRDEPYLASAEFDTTHSGN